MLLEICASNYQSAINAQNAGAHRIELCSELAIGGITPSFGFIKQVLETIEIPVFVLIRPRSENFVFSEDEFEIMKHDIQLCKDLGCKGIVSGVLNVDNTIDIERTRELVALSKPLCFTFHRAFDCTPNPYDAMEQLIKLNVDRILTSGQESSAEKGIFVLQQLKKLAIGKIIILPGGGINSENALIFKGGSFEEIHCSASVKKPNGAAPQLGVKRQLFFDETINSHSDIAMIQSILKQIHD